MCSVKESSSPLLPHDLSLPISHAAQGKEIHIEPCGPLTRCVTLSKSVHFSSIQFPSLLEGQSSTSPGPALLLNLDIPMAINRMIPKNSRERQQQQKTKAKKREIFSLLIRREEKVESSSPRSVRLRDKTASQINKA